MSGKISLDTLTFNVEALIFSSESSISLKEIRHVLQQALEQAIEEPEIQRSISDIQEKYDENFALELVYLDGGYQFLTKKKYYRVINRLQIHRSKKKLSQAALETLAIVAYRQPVTKLEIEQIRGVNCDYTVQKLLEKELISISGKAESIGKPLLYSTGLVFMDYFGINDKAELPKINELSSTNNEIGRAPE